MSSTNQIYMLCRELSDKIGELGSSEQRTSYAHTLRELLSIAEKRLAESREMDAEKSYSRCR